MMHPANSKGRPMSVDPLTLIPGDYIRGVGFVKNTKMSRDATHVFVQISTNTHKVMSAIPVDEYVTIIRRSDGITLDRISEGEN